MVFEFRTVRLPDGREALRLTLPIYNPNPHPIRLNTITYSLRIGTRTIAEGTSPRAEVVQPEGHAVLLIDHESSGWRFVLKQLTEAESRHFEGRLYVSDPLPAGVARCDDCYFEAIGTPR